MKKAIIRALSLTAAVTSVSASALDLQKVYDVLQAPFAQGGAKSDLLKLEEGKIVATYAKGVGGLTAEQEASSPKTLEDCRQLALRQAVLDATIAGHTVREISRKNSHRISFALGKTDGVEALIGLKVTTAVGAEEELTYTYKFEDPADGNCKMAEMSAPVSGFTKKKAVENRVATEIIPSMTGEQIQAEMTEQEVGTPADLTDKMVTKIYKHECEQVSINTAIQLSTAAFKAEFGSNPVVLLDWEQSVVDPIDGGEPGKFKNGIKGFWAIRMVDASGAQVKNVKLNFALDEKVNAEGDEICMGSIDTAVTPL